MEIDTSSSDPAAARRDALVERLGQAGTGLMELCTVYLGERLGYYEALAAGEPLTSTELAQRTGTHERYAREWLEQQATTGFVDVEDPMLAPLDRRFLLPPGYAAVLSERTDPNYMGAMNRLMVSMTQTLPALLEAYRTGGGVPYEAYGADLREGMADAGRAVELAFITETLPVALPDVHARLQRTPPAHVAEIGCGGGWAAIAIAQTYPLARIDGFDLDAASVELARHNVAQAGVADRVQIIRQDASEATLAGQYDLVMAQACVHDTPQPVPVLQTMRRLAREEGVVLLTEPKSGDRFMDPANNLDVERNHYTFSVLHCLPVSMVEQPSVGTGTMMRPDILRGYAREAGFREVEVVPVDDDWTSAFRLRS
jgi:SAM-dependent methyltransferase